MTPDDIADDDPLFAGGLGLDSIDALEIVVMLESEFGIKVKNEASAREHFKSVATLADFVESRVAQRGGAGRRRCRIRSPSAPPAPAGAWVRRRSRATICAPRTPRRSSSP